MTLRDWVKDRLDQDEYGLPTGVVDVIVQGPHSLEAIRDDLPPAHIYGAEGSEPFAPNEVRRWTRCLPSSSSLCPGVARS